MAKTVSINIEIETSKKDQAEAIFNNFGYSITDAINIFLNTVITEGDSLFQIKTPCYNRKTELAIEEARQITRAISKYLILTYLSLSSYFYTTTFTNNIPYLSKSSNITI